MKTTVTQSIFWDYFNIIAPKSFSDDGLIALFECLDDAKEKNEDMELDVPKLCCDFTEYDNLEEFNNDYGTKFKNLDEISEKTTVIEIENTERFIITNY